MTRFGLPEVFLCRHWIAVVLLHRRQHAQVSLYPAVVVVSDVILNHVHKLLTACESSAVITLPLENTPETFHRAVINALSDTRHALCHAGFFQLVMECSIGILVTTVRVEDGMSSRIASHSLVQGLENKRIVVSLAYYERHNPAVI